VRHDAAGRKQICSAGASFVALHLDDVCRVYNNDNNVLKRMLQSSLSYSKAKTGQNADWLAYMVAGLQDI